MFEKITKNLKSLVFRIQLLKGLCVLLLGLTLVRLYQMQVIYSAQYESFLEDSSVTRVSGNVPRGRIYDRNLELLVDNDAVYTLTYTFSSSIGQTRMRQLATEVATLLDEVDRETGGSRITDMIAKLRERDKQDLWIALYPEEAFALVSPWLEQNHDEALQMLNGDEEALAQAISNPLVLDDTPFSQIQRQAITTEMIEGLTPLQQASQVILNGMNQGTTGTVNMVVNRVTEDERDVIAEHLRTLEGFAITVSWEREYPSAMGFSGIFGRVTTYEQGLPSEQADRLKALGYRSNDRVGRGQLEGVLEPILKGVNSVYDVTTENGATFKELVFEGQAGMNVSLTIDAKLQEKVDEIMERQMERSRREQKTAANLREGYLVMLNPNTGEILTMNGMVRSKVLDDEGNETGAYEWVANPLGTIQMNFEMGSTVKGASLLLGYQEGATVPGQTRYGSPLVFPGSPLLKSWRDLGTVSDLDALMYSSNVYFWLQTIALGGGAYRPNESAGISAANQKWLLQLYREFFAQFGLGSSTGIELNELPSNPPATAELYQILYFAIGQFDTFTTMQLAQYAMTLANGGTRYATQLIKDIYLPSNVDEDMRIQESFTPRILNTVDIDQSYFDRVREGFRRALQDTRGTGYSAFAGATFNPAGKTGTAQTLLLDEDGYPVSPAVNVHNVTFVGWAPVENPEVAIAVILPAGEIPGEDSNNTAQRIAREAMEAYFELNKE